MVFTGGVTPLEAGTQADMKRLVAGGKRQQGKGAATQWVDFEIVN